MERFGSWASRGVFVWAIAAAPAQAGVDVLAGIGGEVALETSRPDGVGFGPGGGVRVPVRLRVAPWAELRGDVGIGYATGQDRVSWTRDILGDAVRFSDASDHRASLADASASFGVGVGAFDALVVSPYAYGSLGVSWISTFHQMSGVTTVVVDPDLRDEAGERALDPWTTTASVRSDLGLGVSAGVSDRLEVWAEIGYSAAFVGQQELRRSREEVGARREAFGWNPIRAGVGLLFRVGRSRTPTTVGTS